MPKAVKFSTTTGDSSSAAVASASFTNSDSSGPCQVCHTRTVNPGTAAARWQSTGNADTHYTAASGTQACTDCHSHTQGFGAAESTGGTKCSGCHKTIWNMVTGATPGIVSKHTLGSVLGVNDAPTDSGITWASPLGGNAPAARSCVNMCHDDHVHNPVAGTTHDADTYANATTAANRAMTRGAGGVVSAGAPARTDFDTATGLGTCVSCHQYPVESGTGATHPAIGGAAFNASAHDFISNTVGTTTYQWDYVLHDGSTYDRNCTKCHASRTEGNTPTASGTGLTAVHGTPDPSLLSGSTNPAGATAGFVCYNCHGSLATPAAGAQGDRSNKRVQQDGAKASGHPFDADAVHNTVTELSGAVFGNALGVTGRHASCLDCHDPHEAKGGTHTVGGTTGNVAGPSLQGAWGVKLSTSPALWTAPTSASFTRVNSIAAGVDLEATLCFKCHSSYYWGTGAPPNGLSANGTQATPPETDVAMEFNPANASGHPVLAGLNSYTGNGSTLKALVAGQMVAPWTAVGTQTMACSDCHATDAASPAAQGPHGSASQFMLKGANAANWPNVTLTSFATSWCANCHANSAGQPHTAGEHTGQRCYACHIVVPHGGKLARLIGDRDSATMPARYAYNGDKTTLQVTGFTKAATSSYQKSNCGAQCNTSTHPVTNGAQW